MEEYRILNVSLETESFVPGAYSKHMLLNISLTCSESLTTFSCFELSAHRVAFHSRRIVPICLRIPSPLLVPGVKAPTPSLTSTPVNQGCLLRRQGSEQNGEFREIEKSGFG